MPSLLVVAKTINDNLIQKYISFSDYLCHVSCLSVLCICGTKLKFVDIAILSLKWWKNYLSFYQGFRSALRAVLSYSKSGYSIESLSTLLGPDYDGGKHETSHVYLFVILTLTRKGRWCWFYEIGSTKSSTSRNFGKQKVAWQAQRPLPGLITLQTKLKGGVFVALEHPLTTARYF